MEESVQRKMGGMVREGNASLLGFALSLPESERDATQKTRLPRPAGLAGGEGEDVRGPHFAPKSQIEVCERVVVGEQDVARRRASRRLTRHGERRQHHVGEHRRVMSVPAIVVDSDARPQGRGANDEVVVNDLRHGRCPFAAGSQRCPVVDPRRRKRRRCGRQAHAGRRRPR